MVIGIVILAIGIAASSLLSRWGLWMITGTSPWLLWPTFLLVPIILIRKPLNLTEQELTVIFAMLITASYIPYMTSWMGPSNWFYVTSPYFAEDVVPFVPQYFYEPFSVAFAYWTVFLVLNFLMVLTFLQIWRRQTVDIERLAFPVSVVPQMLIVRNVEGESLFSKRGFQIAILVGLALGIVSLIADVLQVAVAPEIGNLLGYLSGGTYPVAPFPLMPVDAFLEIGLGPFFYAIALLLPLDFLLTGFIMYLAIYVAYPLIAVPIGAMPPLVLSGSQYTAGKYIACMYSFRPMAAFCWAGPLAMGVGLFILNFGYVKRTLTGGEEESNEVMPYRYLWILTLVFFVLSNAIMIASGALWSSAIISNLMALFGTLGLMYAYGMGAGLTLGMGGFNLWNKLPTHMLTAYPFFGNADYAYTPTGFVTTSITLLPYSDNTTMGAGYDAAFYSYKISDEVKAGNRGVFFGQIVAVVFGVMFSMALLQWLTTEYGWRAPTNPGSDYGVPVVKTGRYALAYLNDVNDQLMSMVAGFIIVLIVTYLRAVVPGFFLNPAAMIIAGHNQGFGQTGMGIICLVSYLIKLVMLRTYGAEKWRSKATPALVGFIAGYAVGLGLMFTIISAQYLVTSPGLVWWE